MVPSVVDLSSRAAFARDDIPFYREELQSKASHKDNHLQTACK